MRAAPDERLTIGIARVKILVLAPHPFFQARGTPLAVRTVLEFLSGRGHHVDVLTLHEGEDVAIPNCRIFRIPALPGIRNVRPGFSFKKVVCDVLMFVACMRMVRRSRYDLIHAVEESAFIAAASQTRVTASPTSTTWIPRSPSRWSRRIPAPVRVAVHALLRVAGRSTESRRADGVRRARGRGAGPRSRPSRSAGSRTARCCRRVAPGDANGSGPLPEAVKRDGPIAMYVGNLERYQGIDLLLEGFRHTLRTLPSANLVIVGGRADDILRYREDRR